MPPTVLSVLFAAGTVNRAFTVMEAKPVSTFAGHALRLRLMNWSMPRPVLKVVAVVIGVASLGAFTAGILTAPPRGRLPGERLDGVTGQPIEARDATPLVDERIQGAPEPVALTEEEKARLEAEKLTKAEALALAKVEADKGAPAGPSPSAPTVAAPQEKIEPSQPPPPPKTEEPLF